MGARYGQEIGRLLKLLHSYALRRAGGDFSSMMF